MRTTSALLALVASATLGATSHTAASARDAHAAAPGARATAVCSTPRAHLLKVLLPPSADTTIRRAGGDVVVDGFDCLRSDGTPYRVRSLRTLQVRVDEADDASTGASQELVTVADPGGWRTRFPARRGDRHPLVRFDVEFGKSFREDADTLTVTGSAGADRWRGVFGAHGFTADGDGDADVSYRGRNMVLQLSTGGGADRVLLDRRFRSRVALSVDLGAGRDRLEAVGGWQVKDQRAITTGSGDDRIHARGGLSLRVSPGTGDDVITGRGADLEVVAEAAPDGADRIRAAGLLVLDYHARTTQVLVSLDGRANDGARGEGDDVGTTAWSIVTGNGDDVVDLSAAPSNPHTGRHGYLVSVSDGRDLIVGSRYDDLLEASYDPTSGPDDIEGGAGDDQIDSLATGSHLRGGPGRDQLSGAAGAHLEGGPGNDGLVTPGGGLLEGGTGDDTLHADEDATVSSELHGGAGDDLLRSRNDAADRVDGGSGTDCAASDDTDTLTSVEEERPVGGPCA